MSRELLSGDAGTGTGDGPLTIDLDSTLCETYVLGKHKEHGTMATPPEARPTSGETRWDECATPEPKDNSPCGPTAACTPTSSSPPAAG